MNFVNSLRAVWNRVTQADRSDRRRGVSRGRGYAGVYVDADSALKTSAVWACVTYRSNTIAQLPWRVMRANLNGTGGLIASTHRVDYLIHTRPNPEMGSFTFRQTLTWWATMRGNGYAEIERDLRGIPVALWPLHPDRVEVRRDEAGRLFYRVRNSGGGTVDIDAMDMLHIRGFGDGPVGMGVVDYAAQSIGWAQATEIFGAAFFGEGMNPSGIVEQDPAQKSLSPEALMVLKDDMRRVYGGPKGERTVFLDRGLKFTKLSTQPNDAQFIETRQHQVEEICRWFGVPPHKIMHLLRATFSNIEHQSIEVVVDSITPWVKVWEEEADYKLFGAQNRQGLYTKMNLNGLMRGDSKSRAEYYSKLAQIGVLSPNDIRRFEDMNPVSNGNTYFVQGAMTPIQRAIEGPPQPVPPAPQAPEPGADTQADTPEEDI